MRLTPQGPGPDERHREECLAVMSKSIDNFRNSVLRTARS